MSYEQTFKCVRPYSYWLATDTAAKVGRLVLDRSGKVLCPSVRLFPLCLLNQLTFETLTLIVCMSMGHDHSSPEIESHGQGPGLRLA